jgi:hypothetical protein
MKLYSFWRYPGFVLAQAPAARRGLALIDASSCCLTAAPCLTCEEGMQSKIAFSAHCDVVGDARVAQCATRDLR